MPPPSPELPTLPQLQRPTTHADPTAGVEVTIGPAEVARYAQMVAAVTLLSCAGTLAEARSMQDPPAEQDATPNPTPVNLITLSTTLLRQRYQPHLAAIGQIPPAQDQIHATTTVTTAEDTATSH